MRAVGLMPLNREIQALQPGSPALGSAAHTSHLPILNLDVTDKIKTLPLVSEGRKILEIWLPLEPQGPSYLLKTDTLTPVKL